MINVVHLGIGPLGRKVVKYAAERGCFNIVGAVDPAAEIAGKELGQLCGVESLKVNISSNLHEALKGKSADVALVTTVSSISAIAEQIEELAKAGIHIISSCEELFFPWKTHRGISERIDRICRDNGVVCLGTGVNPGYLMDFLPTVLTGLCSRVESVKVWRVQDASIRRVPFQRKIGAALTLEEFEVKKKAGTLRHVGLPESVDFIADRLGWKLDRNIESLEPVIAERDIDSGYKKIEKGMARGVYQVGRGFVKGREVITLIFKAAVGEREVYDKVVIEGEPGFESKISGGINGDIATCAVMINAVRSVLQAGSGLKTMADIPSIGFFTGK